MREAFFVLCTTSYINAVHGREGHFYLLIKDIAPLVLEALNFETLIWF